MPTVSVIIPTYNHMAYILEAIESVLTQTYPDLEILVIDDGSTDTTRERLTPYIERKQIRYFYQTNQGLAAARNTGLKLAGGPYVKFLDSDDFLYPMQIAKQMEDILQANDPAMMSMTNFCMRGPSGQIANVDVPMAPRDKQMGHFIESNRGAIHSFIFPKKMLEDVGGFDERLKACEDFDLKLRLLMKGAYVGPNSYTGCCYRLIHSSMSTDTLHMFQQKCLVYEKLNGELLKNPALSQKLSASILYKNTMLIHECVARRLSLDRILPKTSQLTEALYEKVASGVVKFFCRGLGFQNYARLRYHLKNLTDKQYTQEILTQEISWKIQ